MTNNKDFIYGHDLRDKEDNRTFHPPKSKPDLSYFESLMQGRRINLGPPSAEEALFSDINRKFPSDPKTDLIRKSQDDEVRSVLLEQLIEQYALFQKGERLMQKDAVSNPNRGAMSPFQHLFDQNWDKLFPDDSTLKTTSKPDLDI